MVGFLPIIGEVRRGSTRVPPLTPPKRGRIRRFVHIYLISLPPCERVIVSVFDDDTWLAIHLCELARDESYDAMLEVWRIIEKYW